MGHSSIVTTEGYLKLELKRLKEISHQLPSNLLNLCFGTRKFRTAEEQFAFVDGNLINYMLWEQEIRNSNLYPDNGKYQFSDELVLRRGSFFLYLIIYLFLICSLIVIYIQINLLRHNLKDIESLVVYLGDYESRTNKICINESKK